MRTSIANNWYLLPKSVLQITKHYPLRLQNRQIPTVQKSSLRRTFGVPHSP